MVKLIYLPLATPEEAVRRVEQRVKQGGHGVPEEWSDGASPEVWRTSGTSTGIS